MHFCLLPSLLASWRLLSLFFIYYSLFALGVVAVPFSIFHSLFSIFYL